MVTAARFRALALGLANASAAPHFDRTAFRTPRKIFATLPADGGSANLMLLPELQAAVLEELPRAFQPVRSWRRTVMGIASCRLCGKKVEAGADRETRCRACGAALDFAGDVGDPGEASRREAPEPGSPRPPSAHELTLGLHDVPTQAQ